MNGAASRFSWPRASRARSSRSTKSGCGRRCAVSILHSRSWLTSTCGANCRNERPAALRRARSSAPNSVSAVSRGSDWRRAGRTRQLLPHTIRLTSDLAADTVGVQCQPSLTPLQRRGGQCRVGYTYRGGCLQPSAGVGDPFLYERLARGAIFECLEQALETVGVAGTDRLDGGLGFELGDSVVQQLSQGFGHSGDLCGGDGFVVDAGVSRGRGGFGRLRSREFVANSAASGVDVGFGRFRCERSAVECGYLQ